MARSSATLLLLLAALLAPLALAQRSNLLQDMAQSGSFTGFLRLLEHADLVPDIESHLEAGQPVTFFCPTDDALISATSPTLLAFLKLQENKAALRQLLLQHIVAERLSPFQWEGAHASLAGTALKLSMDSQAFYADDVTVTKYNAVTSGESSVHALSALIVPASFAEGAKALIERSSDSRRVLAVGLADAPAPDDAPGAIMNPAPQAPAELAAPSSALASLLTLSAALAAALVF